MEQIMAQHHMDSDSWSPIILPLTNLESIQNWSEGEDEFCRATVPLAPRCLTNNGCHIILFHDMMRNYFDDRFLQGIETDDPICYKFSKWQYIDTFIYFSHNIISFPPPCWTNAAHRHGTKVLGCLKLEWKMGLTIYEILLKSNEDSKQFVNLLISIAKYYRFDGWLINVEKEIQGERIISFLQLLTTEIHKILPGSLILWADIFNYGLPNHTPSKLNQSVFSACDGILLESNWTTESLHAASLQCPDRKQYIYPRIDVWGRSGKDQNGFDCHLAVKSCVQHELSVALFAPAWTYEMYREDFLLADNIFWHALSLHSCSFGPSQLPFVTSFCQGYGQKLFQQGKVILNSSWLNLSCQQPQPTTSFYHSDQYSINQSSDKDYLVLKGIVDITSFIVNFRLYHCELEIVEPIRVLFSYQTIQPINSDVTLLIGIWTKNKSKKETIPLQSTVAIPELEITEIDPIDCIDKTGNVNSKWTTKLFEIKPSLECLVIKGIEKIDLQLKSNSDEKKAIIFIKEIKVFRVIDGKSYPLNEVFHSYQYISDSQFISYYQQDAYNGGGCLKLSSNPPHSNNILTFSLYKCNFAVTSPVFFSYTIKTLNISSVSFELVLYNNQSKKVVQLEEIDCQNKEFYMKALIKDEELLELKQYGIDVQRDLEEQWITKIFLFDKMQDIFIKEIKLKYYLLENESSKIIDIYLGQLKIVPLERGYNLPAITDIKIYNQFLTTDYIKCIAFTCILSWTYVDNVYQWFNIFYQCTDNKQTIFLGFSSNTLYKVCKLKLSKECYTHCLKFYIQPVLNTGILVPVEECDNIEIMINNCVIKK